MLILKLVEYSPILRENKNLESSQTKIQDSGVSIKGQTGGGEILHPIKRIIFSIAPQNRHKWNQKHGYKYHASEEVNIETKGGPKLMDSVWPKGWILILKFYSSLNLILEYFLINLTYHLIFHD